MVLEPDALKSFTIPKKHKTSKDLWETVSVNSREYSETVLPAITSSYKDRAVARNFKHISVWFTHNSDLTKKVGN